MNKIGKNIVVFISLFFCGCPTLTGQSSFTMNDEIPQWMGEQDHLEIFALARLASSSHNSQPWKIISLDHEKYLLISQDERHLTEVDPNYREQFLSLGALIENLHLSAQAYGYSLSLAITAENNREESICEFTLIKERGNINQKSINIIKSTHTEKGKLQKKLPESINMEELFNEIHGSNQAYWFPGKSDEFKYISTEAPLAADQQARNDNAQRELADYINYNLEDELKGIGLTPVMLDLPGFMRHSWYEKANAESVMSNFFRGGTSSKVKSQIKNSAGVIILTSPDNSVQSLINCGRLYQRLIISARENHLEIHPLSQLLEEEPWKEEISSKLKISNPVQFILRVGVKKGEKPDYSVDSVSSASIRMPLSNFIEIN